MGHIEVMERVISRLLMMGDRDVSSHIVEVADQVYCEEMGYCE